MALGRIHEAAFSPSTRIQSILANRMTTTWDG
jgi:hypothetical protein